MELPLLAAKDEEKTANHEGSDAGPERNIDVLFLLDGELDGTEFDVVSVLGVAEAPIHESKHTSHDQYDSDESNWVHVEFLSK